MSFDPDAILSDFLFARPSFLEGIARLADVGGTLNEYNTSRSGADADARALQGDWRAIGHDVRVAFDKIRQSLK